jgi:acetyltransferase-like isoleucine patch superfamily enzyme
MQELPLSLRRLGRAGLQARQYLAVRAATQAAYLYASVQGIDIGRDCQFWGLPLLRRVGDSQYQIGSHCVFRSTEWSNLVGMNHRCMVSTLEPCARLAIGDDVGFSGVVIAAAESIEIRRGVLCGSNVTITDADWHTRVDDRWSSGGRSAPVVIGEGVWLGMGAMVLKGVTIGAGTVVAAGSVVSRSLPEGVVAAGVPATVVREVG